MNKREIINKLKTDRDNANALIKVLGDNADELAIRLEAQTMYIGTLLERISQGEKCQNYFCVLLLQQFCFSV